MYGEKRTLLDYIGDLVGMPSIDVTSFSVFHTDKVSDMNTLVDSL